MFPTELKDLFFYFISALTITTALATVLVKNVLQSAIFLIFSFMATAIIYLMLHAEFIAISQVMVYAGGVVIFVIFTILLTSHLGETAFSTKVPRNFIAAFLGLSFLGLAYRFLFQNHSLLSYTPSAPLDYASLKSIAFRLLSIQSNGFVIAFELIGLILFASLIAAVSIARKQKEEK